MRAGWVAISYLLMSFSGIALNVFVLFRLGFLAKRKRQRFMTGCGLPLAAMTTADLLSLVTIVMNILFSVIVALFDPSNIVKDLQCKLVLFVLHTMTTVSIWCWLFATLMRYVAVYHPQMHLSRWRLGCRSLIIVVVVSAVMNCWVPMIAAAGDDLCSQRPLFGDININRILLSIDIFWSYVVPVVITVALDIRVLLQPPPGLESSRLEVNRINAKIDARVNIVNKRRSVNGIQKINESLLVRPIIPHSNTVISASLTPLMQKYNSINFPTTNSAVLMEETRHSPWNSPRPPSRSARARTSISKWLLITTVKLLIVTPDHVLRLITFFCSCMLTSDSSDSSSTMHIVIIIARLLYFTQFWSNAAYLTTVLRSGDIKMRREIAQEIENNYTDNNMIETGLSLPSTPQIQRDEAI